MVSPGSDVASSNEELVNNEPAAILLDLLTEAAGCRPEPSQHLAELNIDSVSAIGLIGNLEVRAGIELDDAALEHVLGAETVADVIAAVSRNHS